MHVVFGQVVGHARQPRVHFAAAQVFGAHDLAGGGLHQRRAAEEDGALVLDDDGLVAHRRHIGTARRTRTHHHRHLRDAGRAQRGLVVEDAAEVIAVGKDLVLVGQVGAPAVDEVDARQPVLARDLLCAQVLLHRQRVVGAALDGGVVADDHALDARDPADAGDHAGTGRGVAAIAVGVHAERGQRRDLEKGCVGIEQHLDTVTRQQLATREMLGARTLATAQRDLRQLGVEIVDQGAHDGCVGLEFLGAGIELGGQRGHADSRGLIDVDVNVNSRVGPSWPSRPPARRRPSRP